jgi:hypothetical protein
MNNFNIKLSLKKKLVVSEKIQGNIYKRMLDLYKNIIMLTNNYENVFSNIIYVNPYFFSDENITKNLKKVKIFNDSKFIKYNSLVKFYRLNEIFQLYFSDILNEKSIVSEFGTMPNLSEVIMYNNYKIKNLNFISTKKNVDSFSEQLNSLIYKLTKLYSFKTDVFTKSLYELINFENIKESDLLCYHIYKDSHNFSYLDNYYNIINLFIGLLIGLKYVKPNGSLILDFHGIINKPTADIYLILKKYYKQSYLYHPEICSHIKRSGTYGIFKGFKGISNAEYDELYNILIKLQNKYPNNIDDFNIYDPELRKYFEVQKPIDNNNIKPYISGFLDLPDSSSKYDEIINFNDNKYIEHYLVLKKLENFMRSNMKSNVNMSKIKVPSQEQLTQSIMYCNKWGIEYYKTNKMIDGMDKEILNEMYGNIDPIIFKFKNNLQIVKSHSKTKTNNKHNRKQNPNHKTKKKSKSDLFDIGDNNLIDNNDLFIINNKISQTGKMIDSRRDLTINGDDKEQLENYYKGHDLFRFYKKTGSSYQYDLAYTVRKNISRNVSQAWLKFYEILADTNIIPKNRTKFKSFHLCEAPGSFIDCLDYYIKKETTITDFKWNAQSYKETKGMDYFGDDYGIIKHYPDRWHWGKDGTGDITKCDNILSYKELCADVDLITSDCGVPMSNPGYHKVLFSSMVGITYLLPKGGNLILKIILPIEIPIIWNIIYLWFSSFKEFSFFKPIQNSFSREFYIIGKGFKGIKEDIMNELLNLVKDKTDKYMTVDLFNDIYPNSFIRQIMDITYKLANNWIFTIEKQIYYSDNMDKISKDFIKLSEEYIQEKNQDFIKKYKLYKIK